MPWKLTPPRKGRSPYWLVRGKYFGIALDKSTGTADGRAAKAILATWKKQAERGEFFQRAGTRSRARLLPSPRPWPTWRLAASASISIRSSRDGKTNCCTTSIRSRSTRWRTSFTGSAGLDAQPAGLHARLGRPSSSTSNSIGRSGARRAGEETSARFWLKPEQAFALLAEADRIGPEFGLLCTLLNYTGLRLSEGLGLQCEQVDLNREFAYIPDTKTGEPRAVYLPPVVVAASPTTTTAAWSAGPPVPLPQRRPAAGHAGYGLQVRWSRFFAPDGLPRVPRRLRDVDAVVWRPGCPWPDTDGVGGHGLSRTLQP